MQSGGIPCQSMAGGGIHHLACETPRGVSWGTVSPDGTLRKSPILNLMIPDESFGSH